MEISKRILGLRKSRGWSRTELANKARISYTALWKIEKGRVSPTYSTLEKIARALGFKAAEQMLRGK